MKYVMVIQADRLVTSGLVEGAYIVREFPEIPRRPTAQSGERYELRYNAAEDRLEWVTLPH
ncbi:MAG: hypothetical protein WDA00_06420 [Eubacteriales bacterium]